MNAKALACRTRAVRAHADTTEHHHGGQLQVFAVDANALFNLRGQVVGVIKTEGAVLGNADAQAGWIRRPGGDPRAPMNSGAAAPETSAMAVAGVVAAFRLYGVRALDPA